MNNKVMVGMSGGVDSSAAAVMLRQQGYDVCSTTLRMFKADLFSGCGSAKECEYAHTVAKNLGFDHIISDCSNEFKNEVIDRFSNTYIEGRTPNPCVFCNKHIKFPQMLNIAAAHDCDYIATGHYARTEYDPSSGRYLLKKAVDTTKDQTYVLYNLTQQLLSRLLLPLGTFTKKEVRTYAAINGLINAQKPDSQDICFIKDGDYASFISREYGYVPGSGNFTDSEGEILGKHRGFIYYTIGQRKGLGTGFGNPMYVLSKNTKTNTVVLGKDEELYTSTLVAKDVNLISIPQLTTPMRVTAKTRYSQTASPATVVPLQNGHIYVEFDEPQRAITPGQAVVIYDTDTVVGGGTIIKEEN